MVPYKVVKASNDDAWIEIDCHSYSPSQICSHLVRELKKNAEAFLGRDVTKAVITAPAYFTDTQRRATMDAARIAGLDVLKIISEPCAAALSYGLNNTKDGHVAILHFGGATLIVSILEISNGAFEIKATSGCTFVGGDAFDDNLLDYLVSEFKKTESIDLSTDKPALQRLREAAEKAKVELSSATQTNIHLPYITSDASGAKHLNITLTRSELESVVGHLIEEINIRCRVCLNNAGLNVKDINEVLLVGGTTRLHKVNEVVTEFFGKSPSKGVSPDEAVALGAAIQGGILRKDLVDVDWRLRGAVTSVMRQGFVNTCWAIGVTAASESAIFIKNGKLNKLSSQQVVDCAVINGCAGAPQSLAYRYIITHGVCLEEQYPYTGVCQPCVDIKSPRFFIDSYGKVPAGNKHLIAAVNRQPLTAVLSRFFVKSPLYQSYRGGTYYGDNSDFPVSDTDLPHLVCIVGCGATEGQKHLIIKESMGVEWGDKGFLYLAMNREFILGLGDVNMAVYYPIINGNRAVCLTEEQISKLKEAFTLFGETKDLGAVMRHLGENLTEAELESMITEGGVDESITFPVFRNMVARKLEDSKIKVLKGLFRVTDKDQDGFVSAADMVQTMPLLGVESVIQLFQETDADGDGLLNCEEFLRMMLIG